MTATQTEVRAFVDAFRRQWLRTRPAGHVVLAVAPYTDAAWPWVPRVFFVDRKWDWS